MKRSIDNYQLHFNGAEFHRPVILASLTDTRRQNDLFLPRSLQFSRSFKIRIVRLRRKQSSRVSDRTVDKSSCASGELPTGGLSLSLSPSLVNISFTLKTTRNVSYKYPCMLYKFVDILILISFSKSRLIELMENTYTYSSCMYLLTSSSTRLSILSSLNDTRRRRIVRGKLAYYIRIIRGCIRNVCTASENNFDILHITFYQRYARMYVDVHLLRTAEHRTSRCL